ncbi:MAG: hypothetical protein U0325_27100 [Polyangiales bacterium]
MVPRRSVLGLIAALTLCGRGARAQAPDLPLQVAQEPVAGSPVRRARVVVDMPTAFPRVAAHLLNFQEYPTFLRRFRSARVVRRNRAETDVYFEVELPRSLGTLWFLHRMTVQRSADHLVIQGVAREGNAGVVETLVDLRRTGENTCRFTFSLYAVPTLPAHPDSVNRVLVSAVEGGAQGLHRITRTP